MAGNYWSRRSNRRKRGFFWQGLLIVLPLVILANLGVFSLRQDRTLVRHEATERAQSIAQDLAERIWNVHLLPKPAVILHVDQQGNLLYPRPVQPLRPQVYDPAALTSPQKNLWEKIRQFQASAPDPTGALAACQEFVKLGVPAPFAASAQFTRGLLLAQTGAIGPAAEAFESVYTNEDWSLIVGETGIPLAGLAAFKHLALEHVPHVRLSESDLQAARVLTAQADESPNELTPYLLEQAVERGVGATKLLSSAWRKWQDQELGRRLYSAAQPHFHRAELSSVAELAAPSQAPKGSLGRRRQVNDLPIIEPISAETVPAGITFPMPRWFWFEAPSEPGDLPAEETGVAAINRGESTGAASLPDGRGSAGLTEPRPSGSATVPERANTPVNINSGSEFLALRFPTPYTNLWGVACYPPKALGPALTNWAEAVKPVPPYCGIALELAGKSFWLAPPRSAAEGAAVRLGKQPARPAPALLASAAKSEGGVELLRVKVLLADPALLFARQQQRTRWFGALIGVSAITALIGLFSGWRAFRHQQRLTELKTNFVSSVSHELRAPIASVRLMAESLEREKIREPARQHEYFRLIVQECRRLSSLIENVLDFSRIEQGRKEYEFEPADLSALLEQTLQLMQPYAAERQIRLEPSLPTQAAIPHPLIDARALQQALINLIDNAIKHSPAGQTVQVGMTVEATGRAGTDAPVLRLWVQDHGEGIPPEEHEKIFERFYRRGSELRRETPGVGIGLSIVKHIAEAHGGRVAVQSEAGQGSRFVIELTIERVAK
jgi:signal transduction histidine kinase